MSPTEKNTPLNPKIGPEIQGIVSEGGFFSPFPSIRETKSLVAFLSVIDN